MKYSSAKLYYLFLLLFTALPKINLLHVTKEVLESEDQLMVVMFDGISRGWRCLRAVWFVGNYGELNFSNRRFNGVFSKKMEFKTGGFKR